MGSSCSTGAAAHILPYTEQVSAASPVAIISDKSAALEIKSRGLVVGDDRNGGRGRHLLGVRKNVCSSAGGARTPHRGDTL